MMALLKAIPALAGLVSRFLDWLDRQRLMDEGRRKELEKIREAEANVRNAMEIHADNARDRPADDVVKRLRDNGF